MNIKNILYNLIFSLRHLSFQSGNQNTIVFIIDDSKRHPGLVDRLKALVCMYGIAKMNGLNYKIFHTYNFLLEDYLVPNKVNWKISKVRYNPLTTKMISYTGYENISGCLKKTWRRYCVYNYLGKNCLQQNNIKDWQTRWRILFDELFIPSALLLESINANLQYIDSKFIAVHYRFVNALEQFEEGHPSTIKTENERQDLIYKCLVALSQIKESNKDVKVVVFTDSNVFREIAEENGYLVTPGEISHTSFSKGNDSNLKTFTDLFVMSKAEKVYRIESEHIYKTMYSYYAAIIGGKVCIDYKI